MKLLAVFAALVLSVGCGARVDDGGASSSNANVQGGESDAGEKAAPDSGEATASDAGSASTEETSVTPVVDAGPAPGAGCPVAPPKSGQSCIASSGIPDEHFYCHYFASDASCATQFKCTQHDGTGAPAHFYGPIESCSFKATDCVEGKDCSTVFEPDGACVVACTRVCMCDAATGHLSCKAIACEG